MYYNKCDLIQYCHLRAAVRRRSMKDIPNLDSDTFDGYAEDSDIFFDNLLPTLSLLEDLQTAYGIKLDEIKSSMQAIASIMEYVERGERLPFSEWLDAARMDNGTLLTDECASVAAAVIETSVIPGSKATYTPNGIEIEIGSVRLLLETRTDTYTNGRIAFDETRIVAPGTLHALGGTDGETGKRAVAELSEYGFSIVG